MSIWGVNQSLPNPSIATAASDVSCPSATETTVITVAGSGATPGLNVIAEISVSCVIVIGATAPSAMVIAAKVAGGSDFDTWTVPPALLTANAVLALGVVLEGIQSRSTPGSGGAFNVTVNPTGQTVTFKAQSRAVLTYSIGADS